MTKIIRSDARLVVVLLLLLLLLLMLIIGFNSFLFESPKLQKVNVNGSRITTVIFNSFAHHAEFPVDTPVYGPNVTAQLKFDFFHVYLTIIVDVPYGFAQERVWEKYNLDDIPCAAYGANFKLGQAFSILSIFACTFTLVFVVGAMFLRVLLFFVWAFIWITIVCVSVANATLFKALFDGFCTDNPVTQIPELSSVTLPADGFLLFLLSLFTSVLTAFLSLLA